MLAQYLYSKKSPHCLDMISAGSNTILWQQQVVHLGGITFDAFTCTMYNYCRVNRLTWHGGVIPNDEVWLNLEEIRVEAHSKCPFSWGMWSTQTHQKTHACSLFMKARTVLSYCTDHKWNRYPILCGGINLCLTKTDLLFRFPFFGRGKSVRIFIYGD